MKLWKLMNNRQYNLKDIYKIGIAKGYVKDDITYTEFSNVSRDFNKEVSNRIINNAYRFNFGIGIIEVKRSKRRGLSIDWHTSKKVRQEIIDRGEIPFSKKDHPEGIKWFVFFEGKDYFKWKWFKIDGLLAIANIKYYIFKPMTGNRKEVGKAVKANPFADMDYGIYK